ncbi:Dabb family protein [Escherichia coli]
MASVREAFLSVPVRIQGVASVEWGENNSPEGKNAGYTHCVMMTFADEAASMRRSRTSSGRYRMILLCLIMI